MAAAARTHSIADQVARFERAKAESNERWLEIEKIFDGSYLKDKRVMIVGANRGLGFAITTEAVKHGAQVVATCRASAGELPSLGCAQIVEGVEVQDEASLAAAMAKIDAPLDIVIINAGYFPDIHETLTDPANPMNFAEELKQIDVCALGPVRCTHALRNAGLLRTDGTSQVVVISSQAGSAEWRFTQNKDEGGDYGHHMSRAACNIACCLMSEELKKEQIAVVMLHPGFNRTDMTAKYAEIWDKEGAVEKEVGAIRVLHEVGLVSLETTGRFINCEDGLQIPW